MDHTISTMQFESDFKVVVRGRLDLTTPSSASAACTVHKPQIIPMVIDRQSACYYMLVLQ